MRLKPLRLLIVLVLVVATGINLSSSNGQVSSTSFSQGTSSFRSQPLSTQFNANPDDSRVTQTSASMASIQGEPSIAINPHKQSNIIVGYNDWSVYPSSHWRPHWSYTTNGGTTWRAGAATLPSGGTSGPLCCDTNLAFDSNGDAFLVTMTQGTQILLYVSTPDGSGNAGATWNGPYIVGSGNIDKPIIAVDRTGGAHNGNIYVAWVDYYAGSSACGMTVNTNDRIMVRTATLGGGGVPAFSGAAVQASDPNSNTNWGPTITVSPSGSLYVAYIRLTTLCINTANAMMISRSDNGGSTFALRGQVVDSGPNSPTFADAYSDRFSAFPTITTTDNGTVFVAWTDSGAGSMDVQSRTSLTSGASWNARVRVNVVATNDQFHPAATFLSGTLYVFYYSREGDNPNLRGGPYVASSANGGATFSAGVPFSSTMSDPSAVCVASVSNLCLWGDYIGADSASTAFSNAVCAVWGDSRDSSSATSNDVNVYFRCSRTLTIHQEIAYWWDIQRIVTATAVPFNICIINPAACHAIWTATFIDPVTTGPPIIITLTAQNPPPGVKVALSQTTVFVGGGYPSNNVTIDVDFSGADCKTDTCLQNITIAASDGTNDTSIQSQQVLTNVPYLITNAMVYNPSDTVNVTGIAFTANSTATLKLDGKSIGSSFSTGKYGIFNVPVKLASNIFNGTHTLTGTDTSSSKTFSTTFITPQGADESDSGIKPPSPTPPATPTFSPLGIMLLAMTIGIIASIPMLHGKKRFTAFLKLKP